jgi:hypothetical protein
LPKKILKTQKKEFKFKNQGLFWLPIFMLASTPVLANWLSNRYQVTLLNLALPLILALITSIILALIFWSDFRKDRLSAYIGSFLAILILNNNYESRLSSVYNLIDALNPFKSGNGPYEGIFVSLLFFLLVTALIKTIIYALRKFLEKKNWRQADLTKSLLIVITVLFCWEFIFVFKTIVAEWPEFFYRPPQIDSSAGNTQNSTKPDIYYIVLDRYASPTVLKDQFNFDNADFLNYLTDNKFYINTDSHNNYPYTTMSIASTLNANYLTDVIQKFGALKDQILEPYHDAIRYSSVIQKLKSFGYKYTLIGSWYETTNKSALADSTYQPEGKLTVLNHIFTLDEFDKDNFTQSFYERLASLDFKIGRFTILNYSSISETDATLYKISTLKNLASQTPNGRFIFAHILVPHEPFVFNADGSINANSGDDNQGEPIKTKYINQVEFISNQMKTLIDQINQASHNQSIIILQADEGPYPLIFNDQDFNYNQMTDELADSSMLSWSNQNLKMKFGNLAAYYVPQATTDDLEQGADTVNIFRLIFNTYFNGKMPYLPECYYAYPDGRKQTFVYQNINQQLTGSTNSVCPNNSIFK